MCRQENYSEIRCPPSSSTDSNTGQINSPSRPAGNPARFYKKNSAAVSAESQNVHLIFTKRSYLTATAEGGVSFRSFRSQSQSGPVLGDCRSATCLRNPGSARRYSEKVGREDPAPKSSPEAGEEPGSSGLPFEREFLYFAS